MEVVYSYLIILVCLLSSISLSISITLILYFYNKNSGGGIFNLTLSNSSLITSNAKPKSTKTELDCTVNNLNNVDEYTCSDPVSQKGIKLINGPVLTISYSKEIDSFQQSSSNYYIIVPYDFIVTYIISISSGEIKINSLDDLLESFNNIENNFKNTRPICSSISEKVRIKGSKEYNTTCIFFEINKIDSILSALKNTLLPYIPQNVKTEYYNVLVNKISNNQPLTILEYIMYLGLLKSDQSYYTLCTSDNPQINC